MNNESNKIENSLLKKYPSLKDIEEHSNITSNRSWLSRTFGKFE